MKIVVCIKQVPDTTKVSVDQETGVLQRQGVPSIMNPDDKSALELALSIKDKDSSVEVVALTMGPTQAEDVLVEALCMGADKGYLLTDRTFAGADTLATSFALASAIKRIGFDIVICGRQAIDGDTAQVGPEIAEHLDIPHASYVGETSFENGVIKTKRFFENGYQLLSIKLPCLLTALGEKIKPRYMNASKIVDNYEEADITILSADDLGVDKSRLGLLGSPTKVKKSVPKVDKVDNAEIIENDVSLSVNKILDLLQKVNEV